jgi:hypothetical protein
MAIPFNVMIQKADQRKALEVKGQCDRGTLIPFAIASAVFLLYLFTLAPTVLWGDDAFFQRSAYEGTLGTDGGGHWLWFQLARLFIHLPVGDIAYRVNLLSAVAAALTIFVIYPAALALGLSRSAATSATLSLAVAHTFWMHAVRAEVYTIFTLWMAVELWLWAKWNSTTSWSLELAAFLFGIGLLSHQMGILLLPAWALLLWLQRSWLNAKQWMRLIALFAAGIALFLAIVQGQVMAPKLVESLIRYFTHSGRDFSSSFFDFAWATLPGDLLLWLGFLGLQFAGISGLLGLWAIIHAIRRPAQLAKSWYAIAAIYLTNVFFALSYRVNDQYVFYLPSYIAFALIAGLGWDFAVRDWGWLKRPAIQGLMLLLLAGIPPFVYYSTAATFAAMGVNPLGIRSLPGREPNSFFLWPGKAGYYGAADYGTQALAVLPSGSYLIADHTPRETIVYLQRIEKARPDLHVIKIEAGDDLAPIIQAISPQSNIFLADNDPRYYNLSNLPKVELKQNGVIYQLVTSEE